MPLHSESAGPYLRHTRKLARLTLAEVAAVSGFTKSYIAQIERGEKSPPLSTIAKITQAIQEASYSKVASPGTYQRQRSSA